MKISILGRSTGRGRRGRTSVAVALGAVLALTATACGDDGSGSGDGAEGSGTGKIVFWDNNGGVRTDIWKEIIADFEKKNPDIDVEYVGIASTEYQSKVDTAIQGGGLPDVGGISASMLAGFAAQGALEPLDERLEGSSLNGKLNKDMIESLRAAGGGDDQLYSVPTSANNGVLYYRTDMFEQATWRSRPPGTASSRPRRSSPTRAATASATPSAAELTHRPGPRRDVRAVRHHLVLGLHRQEDHGQRPEERQGAGAVRGAVQEGHPAADLNNDFTKMVAQWDSGEIGMLNHNLGSYQDHVKALGTEKFRGIPQPVGPGGKRVQVSNPVDGIGLFKSSENKDAAWKFIEFAASAQSNSKFNESAGQVLRRTRTRRRTRGSRRRSRRSWRRRRCRTGLRPLCSCRTTCLTGTPSRRRTTSRTSRRCCWGT